jgi:hypothetical protein
LVEKILPTVTPPIFMHLIIEQNFKSMMMLKKTPIVYLCLLFCACANPKPDKVKVTEIVIYQLKSDKVTAYSAIAETTNAFLKTQKGFLSRKILQDHKDHTIFMDIVEWETLSDAENAMQNAQKEPSLIPFFEATEKVISFSHYNPFQ